MILFIKQTIKQFLELDDFYYITNSILPRNYRLLRMFLSSSERKKTGRDKKSGGWRARRWLLQLPGVLLQLPFNRLNNCAPYTRAEIIVFCIIRMTLVRRRWARSRRNESCYANCFTPKCKIMWIPSFAPPLIKLVNVWLNLVSLLDWELCVRILIQLLFLANKIQTFYSNYFLNRFNIPKIRRDNLI